MERFLWGYSDYLYALMRIFVGLAFSCNGARKLFGVFGGLDGAGAAAQFPAQYWFAGMIEFFGGVLVAIGDGPQGGLLAVARLIAPCRRRAPLTSPARAASGSRRGTRPARSSAR